MNYIKMHSAMELAYEQAQDDYLNISVSAATSTATTPSLVVATTSAGKMPSGSTGQSATYPTGAKHSKADDIKSPPVPVASVRRRRTFGLRGSSHHGAAH